MAHLVNLDGTPLTWPTLHARREAYYAAKEEAARERVCGACRATMHGRCSGWMSADGSVGRSPYDRIPCPCECRVAVPA